ncbi:ras-like protein [Anaeramoeba ignava]|uniref:Ras-like protein n=1 Tax=Anaeramoeba ignava TaxID=1746090 RepID=A0A9Q0R5K6_ANAIG|nr:ras-like protein [Anaeramoeba ignava]|eukprot:Anaeramoba_ignava/a348269_84.p1 GENE.a348269_84~~a348269_84.p1  ORF type:complete len:220 (-),score=70.79 a348269_84:28-666(-)
MNKNELTIVMAGDGGVGKSCITIRYVKQIFHDHYDPTLEESYRTQVEIDNSVVTLDIIDTAGQEEFKVLRDTHLSQGDGYILVFSIIEKSGLDEIEKLRGQILRFHDIDPTEPNTNPPFPIMIAGNKSDLEEYREVPTETAKQMADQWGLPYIETSAKNGTNISELYAECVRMVRKYKKGPTTDTPNTEIKTEIKTQPKQIPKEKSSCCLIL